MDNQEQWEKDQQSRADQAYNLYKGLLNNQQFQEWRDIVAKPQITALENDLSNPLVFDEATLKAKVMHLNFVKALMFQWFDEVRENEKIEQLKK
jgi:hypothetical protein